ncbi:MAG: helix-turn-helix domain-containing protein [Muribaculaceae bacterium]
MNKIIKVEVGTMPQLTAKKVCSYHYDDAIEVIVLEGDKLNGHDLPDVSTPLKVDAFHTIMTMAGTARMDVNSEEYVLLPNTTLNLIGAKVLRNVTFSHNYKGYHLMVSMPFYNEVFKEGKHLTPETAMYKTHFPFDILLPHESKLIEQCILSIIKSISRHNHIWHRRMVEANVRIFFMEMGNIIISKTPIEEVVNLPNHDILFYRFMQLVNSHCTERKPVTFFADKLCLSPDYLAQAIKAFSKKPISHWINQALVMQAKTHLMDKRVTIQQIAAQMNFSDQSSFGRFFKRNTGKTPAEYRKQFR